MAYTDQKEYAKFLKKKCIEESNGCGEGCGGCKEGCDENECSCCPPGLVAYYDDKGTHRGCLTPNDAELHHLNTFTCLDGFVKLYKEGVTPTFLGCVSEQEFAALYAAVNPTV